MTLTGRASAGKRQEILNLGTSRRLVVSSSDRSDHRRLRGPNVRLPAEQSWVRVVNLQEPLLFRRLKVNRRIWGDGGGTRHCQSNKGITLQTHTSLYERGGQTKLRTIRSSTLRELVRHRLTDAEHSRGQIHNFFTVIMPQFIHTEDTAVLRYPRVEAG
jgi:hypothetical protein